MAACGNDSLTGGTGADEITTGAVWTPSFAGAEGDQIFVGADLTAADSIDGGADYDVLFISGAYARPSCSAPTRSATSSCSRSAPAPLS
jgi:hypothetical protein